MLCLFQIEALTVLVVSGAPESLQNLSQRTQICIHPPDLSHGNSKLVNQPNSTTMHKRRLNLTVMLHKKILDRLPVPILARLRPLNGDERIQASGGQVFNFSAQDVEPGKQLLLDPPNLSQ